MNRTDGLGAFRLWLEEPAPGDGERLGRFLGEAATLAEADELGQRFADYHRGPVVAYPPVNRYLIGTRAYAPEVRP